MIYKFKEGSHINLDAEKVHKELNKIGECLTPEKVVEYARKENSELHKGFEWDDSIAAGKFRKEQARHIINCIIFESEQTRQEMKCYESVKISDKQVFAPIQMIMETPSFEDQLYDSIKSGIIQLDNKLKDYQTFSKRLNHISKNISAARKQIEATA
jgi:hypothetical protein